MGRGRGPAARPHCVVVSDSGNHRVQAFNLQGNHLHSFGAQADQPGQLQQPCGIAVDRHRGLVWVADTDNHRVQVFDGHGWFLGAIGREGCFDPARRGGRQPGPRLRGRQRQPPRAGLHLWQVSCLPAAHMMMMMMMISSTLFTLSWLALVRGTYANVRSERPHESCVIAIPNVN